MPRRFESFTHTLLSVLKGDVPVEAVEAPDAVFAFGCARDHVGVPHPERVPFEATWANRVLPTKGHETDADGEVVPDSHHCSLYDVDPAFRQPVRRVLAAFAKADADGRVTYAKSDRRLFLNEIATPPGPAARKALRATVEAAVSDPEGSAR